MTNWYNYKSAFKVAKECKKQWNEFCQIKQVTNEQVDDITSLFETTKELDKGGIYGCFCQSIEDDNQYYDLTKNDFILIDVLVSQKRDYFYYTKLFWSEEENNLTRYVRALYAHIELHKGIIEFGNNEIIVSVLQKIIRGIEAHSLSILENYFGEDINKKDFENELSSQLNEQPFKYGVSKVEFITPFSLPKTHTDLINFRERMLNNKYLKLLEIEVSERDRIITTISHNIKGTIGSVITNLNSLKGTANQNRNALEGALRGVKIISKMVADIQNSYKYNYQKFCDDICSPGDDGICFYDIVLWGTKIVVDSIFSDDFYEEQKRFFSDDEKECLYGEYTSLPEGLECLQEYINKNLASMEFRIPEHLLKTKIGNLNGTATNIYIVLNELMKNAFRALAQVPREKRVFSIEASERENDIVFVIENSCSPQSDQRVKGVGFGGLITSKIVAAFGRMEKTYSDNREYFTVQITVPKITGEKA